VACSETQTEPWIGMPIAEIMQMVDDKVDKYKALLDQHYDACFDEEVTRRLHKLLAGDAGACGIHTGTMSFG